LNVDFITKQVNVTIMQGIKSVDFVADTALKIYRNAILLHFDKRLIIK